MLTDKERERIARARERLKAPPEENLTSEVPSKPEPVALQEEEKVSETAQALGIKRDLKIRKSYDLKDDEPFVPEKPVDPQILDFQTPSMFFAFFSDELQSETVKMYDWQHKFLNHTALPTWSIENPCKIAIKAANGSGKDAFLIAPFACWLAGCFPQAQVVITSSSSHQIGHQTEPRIRHLVSSVNRVLGFNYFIAQKRHIFSPYSGSVIDLYVTDEEGRAEGWHPLVPGSKFAMIFNEAKSIPDKLFTAAERCNGYQYWIELSSTGEAMGHFYESFKQPDFKKFSITFKDCPHIAKSQVESLKRRYGESSALFLSSLMSEFSDVGVQTLIPLGMLNSCMENPPKEDLECAPLRAGVDLSLGGEGDETVVSIWKGNTQLAQKLLLERDANVLVFQLCKIFQDFSLKGEFIHVDDGGLGKPIIDNLHKAGYQVNRVNNQWPASSKFEFGNLGAELWFNFRVMVAEQVIRLSNDDILKKQLISRCYRSEGKIFLEKKKDMRARGLDSPDRADAAVLANRGLSHEDFVLKAKPSVEIGEGEVIVGKGIRRFSRFLEKAKPVLKDTRIFGYPSNVERLKG